MSKPPDRSPSDFDLEALDELLTDLGNQIASRPRAIAHRVPRWPFMAAAASLILAFAWHSGRMKEPTTAREVTGHGLAVESSRSFAVFSTPDDDFTVVWQFD